MSLTKEKVEKNAKKFFQTGEEYGFMPESLITFLGAEIIAAPASSMLSMNNTFEGGLIDHMLKVAYYAVKSNDTLPENKRVEKSSLVKVCCLHQIGKVRLYKPCESEWHQKNQGKMYDYNTDVTSMNVGERSVYYALSHGVELTEDEFQAIVNFDKSDDDKQAKFHTNTLGKLLKIGNIMAIIDEK